MQGNTAPIGGTGGWSPSSGSGGGHAPRPGGLHLQVPPTTQPSGPSSSAGGFITPTLSPSPGGHTPPPPGNNSGFAGGFAPQGPPPPIVPRNPQQDEFVTCSPCFCFWPAFELNCVFVFGRCYNWFVAIDQDGSGEISPQELRTFSLFFSRWCKFD